MKSWRWCVLVLLAAACTKRNPEVCCLDPDDCASIGVSDPVRECAEGLACVDNACQVASCSTDGCSAEAPVCDITLDVCAGCETPSDCERFADTNICDPSSGACVECIAATDCATASPVCDIGTCRSCKLDSECASGACGDDGACVDEARIVYVDPVGVDAAPCSRAAPCQRIKFGVGQSTTTRNHIVLATGTYLEPSQINISAQDTAATSLVIHGGGSTVSDTSAELLFAISLPTTIRDLTLEYRSGRALAISSPTRIERLTINSRVQVGAPTIARDIHVTTTTTAEAIAVIAGGALDLDRAVLQGGANVLRASSNSNAILTLSNVVAFGASDAAFDLGNSSGSIEFVTIGRSGAESTTAAGINCNVNHVVRSSIIWTAGSFRPAISGGCTLTSVTAGPIAVAGAANNDPLFVNEAANDFHLGVGSPARDAVDVGPSVDFEGDPRPQGVRFDLGADEAAP